jgi:nicotinate-nucleotide adenylyltransferase
LRLADAARAQLQLGRVLWVLTGDPPHKQEKEISPVADRLAMLDAMISGEPGYVLSRVDLDRPGPHWAADTVRLLAQQFPEDELVYLMGGDSLRDLPTWGRPLEFLAHCTLGVMRRPGDAIDLAALEQELPGVTARVEFVEAPPLSIASHDLRARVRAGVAMTDWMPEAVWQIIQSRGLYR